MRDSFDREIREALHREPIPVPEEVNTATQRLLEALPDPPPRAARPLLPRLAALAACLALLLVGVLPNLSPSYARAAGEIPLLGRLVQVLTIRNYFYSDGSHELDVQIPEIHDPDHPLPNDLINRDVDELTQTVIRRFYAELEEAGGRGHGSLQVDYQVLTNTEDWFTLKLTLHETAAGSHTAFRFYHIDRRAGRYVTFGDLFDEGDYLPLQASILSQMEAHMARDETAAYWTEHTDDGSPVTWLHPEQNFYFDGSGRLVIVYDAYQVAPGYMGCPEFTLPAELYRPLL